jgi:signal transduction histidine kinase
MLEAIIVFLSLLLVVAIVFIIKLSKKAKACEKFLLIQKQASNIKSLYENLKKGYSNLEKQNESLKEKIALQEQKLKLLEEANLELIEHKKQLRESKEKLELLHKRKQEMFAIALHDIKNPISAIKGYLDLLESYDLTATEQREIIDGLLASSDKVVRLAQEITEAIVSDEIGEDLNLQEASLSEIIHSVYLQNLAYAESKKIKLINKSSSQLPKVFVDPRRIEEALDNYVNNAIKYSEEGAEVIIRSYFTDESISVEVIDSGQGIAKEDLHRVFNKGVILDNKPTGGETRNGIGLWIVKQIIEEHGGRVWVDSKLGAGSAFGFSLPIAKQKAETTQVE